MCRNHKKDKISAFSATFMELFDNSRIKYLTFLQFFFYSLYFLRPSKQMSSMMKVKKKMQNICALWKIRTFVVPHNGYAGQVSEHLIIVIHGRST